MTQSGWDQRPVIEIERPSVDTIEGRASLAFKVLAAIHVAGIVLAQFPPPLAVSDLLTVSFNVAAAVLAVLYVLEARALDRRRPWAVAAVRPMLVLAAASGIGAAALAFGDGKLRIPFEVVPVAWAWLGARDGQSVSQFSLRSLVVSAVVAVAVAVMVLGRGWFGWGGLLDVHEANLQASIQVDCGPPGAALPETILVTYDWSWASISALPNAIDIVVIGWTGADNLGRPLYVLGRTINSGFGVYPGRQGYPSLDMATAVASRFAGSFRWGAELRQQRYQPGHITLELRRTRADQPGPSPLTIGATYVHLGIWHKDAPSVTCTW